MESGYRTDSLQKLEVIDIIYPILPGTTKQLAVATSSHVTRNFYENSEPSVPNMLHRFSGIYMHNGTTFTNRIVIRGMGSRSPYGSNRVKAYLNDIPLTSLSGYTSLEDLDIQSLSSVFLLRGPNSAVYGAGLGGLLRFETKNGVRTGMEAGMKIASFETEKVQVAGSIYDSIFSGIATASFTRSSGYRQNNQCKHFTSLFSGKVKTAFGKIETTLSFARANAGIPSSIDKTTFLSNPEKAATNWNSIKGYKEYNKLLAGISLTNQFHQKYINKLILYSTWFDQFEKRPFNNLDDNSLQLGVRDEFKIHTNRTDWMAGFDLAHENYSWTLLIEEDGRSKIINRNKER